MSECDTVKDDYLKNKITFETAIILLLYIIARHITGEALRDAVMKGINYTVDLERFKK